MSVNQQAIYLGGGCFWCVEAVLRRLKGVEAVTNGYMGGTVENPTDDDIYHRNTGHVEVAEVVYDTAVIDTTTLLKVYFSSHDPTSVNRQGNDVGEQYRSVIFTTTQEQAAAAKALIGELDADGVYSKPIVTDIEDAVTFYKAAEYHQEYYDRNPGKGYCTFVITPKVAKLRKQFAHLLKEDA